MKPEIREGLAARWARLLAPFGGGAEAIQTVFDDLAARYAAPERHYHTLDHIHAMLGAMETIICPVTNPSALELAVWFHDAVYDSRAPDNEERSAALADAVLAPLGVPEAIRAETARLILLTKTHAAAETDADGRLLLDADLAVLGAGEAEYDHYARAIRREYGWVEEAAYRAGRKRVLQGFLDRPRIYQTASLFARREEVARRNLRREIAALE